MATRKEPMSIEAKRRAKELRDLAPRNTRFGPHGYGLTYVRSVLRGEGLGDFTEDQIDQGIRSLRETLPASDSHRRRERFQMALREDHASAPVLSEEEWHRRMRALFAPPAKRGRAGCGG
jgi:hypothetical protein